MNDDTKRFRTYAIKFDFDIGWQITDDKNYKFFQIRDQKHFHRFISGA